MRRLFIGNPGNVNVSDPPPDDHLMHVGVHEASWSQVPMSDPPGGAVRIIASSYGETVSKGARAKAVFNAGQFPMPTLGNWNASMAVPEASGPSTSYDNQVAAFLAENDSGGTHRGSVFEVTNEPRLNSEVDKTLQCIAACSNRLRAAGRRVLFPHVIGSASVDHCLDRLNQPVAATGHCRPEMIDGFSFHSYGDTSYGRIDGMKTLRNKLDSFDPTKRCTIWLTETGWPVDRLGNMDAVQANPGTSWPQDGYSAGYQANRLQELYDYLIPGAPDHAGVNARTLKVRGLIYFAWSDYNPGEKNGYNHCGMVEQDTRASAGPPNYQNAGGEQSWKLHPVPYDGRAKGTGSTFVPGVGPYGSPAGQSGPTETGTALATMRAFPSHHVDLS